MSYRVTWRLVGRADRLLDSGKLDEFGEHASAVEAIAMLLRGFPLSGRNEEAGYWWARRSPDADLEVRLLLRSCHDHGIGRAEWRRTSRGGLRLSSRTSRTSGASPRRCSRRA